MSCNHTTNYHISGRMKNRNQTQESIATIEIHLKKKHQLQLLQFSDDGAIPTVTLAVMESPLVVNKLFPIKISNLLLPRKLQSLVQRTVSTLDLCPCTIEELEESMTISLRHMAKEVVATGVHIEAEIRLDIEDLMRYYDEDEEVARAATDSIDIDGQMGGFDATPASRSSIESLRSEKKLHGKDSGDSCRICLDEFCHEGVKEATCMPCSHVFHSACIMRWLENSNMCPLCRVRIKLR